MLKVYGLSLKKDIIKLILSNFILIASIFGQTNEGWQVYDDTEVAKIYIEADTYFVNWIYNNPHSDSTQPAKVTFINKYINETFDSVGFRLRGNTSRDSQKKSFKLSFNSYKKGGNFYGYEKLNLNGEHNDPSIARSKFCWDLLCKTGLKVTKAAHAAVYINGTYLGLYINVEHIDETFIARNFDDASGNLWKCLAKADLAYYGSDENIYKPGNSYGLNYELKTNEDEDDYSKLIGLIKLCDKNQTSDEKFLNQIENVLDVTQFLKYSAMNILLAGWDDYWSISNNYYLYHEPNADIIRWIPYDYDNTLGVDFFNIDWANQNPYFYPQVWSGDRPLTERLLSFTKYKNLYTHFLEFYNENILKLSNWEDEIDRIHELITPYAEDDNFRTRDYGFTIDDFHNSFTSFTFNNHIQFRQGIKEFIEERYSSLKDQLNYFTSEPCVYDVEWYPKNPSQNDSIYVTIAAFSNDGISEASIKVTDVLSNVKSSFTLAYAPTVSTLVEDNDRWIGVIPPLGKDGEVSFKIELKEDNGRVGLYPTGKEFNVKVKNQNELGLCINELLAKNNSINTSPNDKYSDWIELYNRSETDLDLSGMFLSDNADSLIQWQIPANTIIESKNFLLVWCNGNDESLNLQASFKLDADGEAVYLTDTDGITILDSVVFGDQQSDISYGRFPDGSNNWIKMKPTPNTANENLTSLDNNTKFNGLPKEFKLYQNYPNPFNPTTVIEYNIPIIETLHSVSVQIKLTIYDVLGNKIKTLVDEFQTAGRYSVQFDASNLSSGIYFYRLSAGKYISSKKMILIK